LRRRPAIPRLAAAALAVLLALPAAARAASPAPPGPEVHRHVLDNGLTLLMVERHQAPVVSAVIVVRVGGVDEPLGRTGIAHMFEHMAFKGTRKVGTRDAAREARLLDRVDALMARREALTEPGAADDPDDPGATAALDARIAALQSEAEALVEPNAYGNLFLRQGAVGLNASTGYDVTTYYVSLPANRLPFWAAMEHDRLAHPVFREFYTERDVVAEERRMRVDSSPDGRLWENFLATAFLAHPYGRPVIGWPSDLARLTRPEARAFYRTHYVPGRMVVALVGDLDPERTLDLVRRTLGRLPASPAGPADDAVPTREPEPAGPRRVVVYDDAEPRVLVGYPRPALGDPDDAALEALDNVLGAGHVGRLYRDLVLDQGLAASVSTGSGPGERDPGVFVIRATPRHPHTPDEVEAAVLEEVARLRAGPVEAREVERARNQVEAGIVRSMDDNAGLAHRLAYYEAVIGDWRYPFRLLDGLSALTPEDVRRAAERYLAPERRVVGVLERGPAQGAAADAPAPEAAP